MLVRLMLLFMTSDCSVTDVWRLVNGACARWCPVVQELHHFFLIIIRTVVNSDDLGRTSLHPVVWSNAASPRRRTVDRGRFSIWPCCLDSLIVDF